MPPKQPAPKARDRKGGFSKDKRTPAAAQPGEPSISIEEMQLKLATMEHDLKQEEQHRNYMQLERDKLNAFWDIAKAELDERRAELRNKDREQEELQERHHIELNVYKQKVKHLLYEHQNNIAVLKADGELALKLQVDEHVKTDTQLIYDKRALRTDLRERESMHEDAIRQMRLESAKQASKMRQEYQQEAKELAVKYERKMRQLREEEELRRKQEVHEIQERKNQHIQELVLQSAKAFADIKAYYKDITANNLDMIHLLKESLSDAKAKEAQTEKLMVDAAQENRRLSEPLSRALKDVAALTGQLKPFENEKEALRQTKARLARCQKELKNLEWDNEVLQQRYDQAAGQRDELYGRFDASVQEVKQGAGLKALMLEKMMQTLMEQAERKDAQLGEVVAAAGLDPGVLGEIGTKLDTVLEAKNKAIARLQLEVARVSKAHNDLIRVYEAKLAELGVPPEQLGFKPAVSAASSGPAGLVAA